MSEEALIQPESQPTEPEAQPPEAAQPAPEEASENEAAAQAQPPAEGEGEDSGAETSKEAPRKKNAQQRIAQLVQEREAWRRKATEYEQRAQIFSAQPPADAPKESDYEDWGEYVKALADYHAKQAIIRQQEEAAKAEREAAMRQYQAAVVARVNELKDFGSKKYENFEQVVFREDLPFTPVMTEALLDSEHAEDVAYYLATHEDELTRIAQLPPVAQVRELAKLEIKLSTKAGTPAPKATNAPNPVSLPPSSQPEPDLDSMSIEAFIRKRNKERGVF